ncbi:MAG: 4-hydroxy-tetrahydrodipicolinate reductase [Vampirovibrionales bacterium]|nr:4-hydroxy-tetrahydrodipicolinate reductase [Vampirovibrionales bacterium]
MALNNPSSPAPPIRVVVSGAAGKMGREVVKTVLADPALTLAAAVDTHHAGEDAALIAGLTQPCGQVIRPDLRAALAESQADVCVDFTRPQAALTNALTIIESGCRPVIGTTGLSPDDLQTIAHALQTAGIGGMVVPNFAIGAVLLMKFAQEAARYFDHAELIELHHNQKADAPSGTAVKTALKMQEGLAARGLQTFGADNAPETETIAGARGAQGAAGIRIHSVRLPGLVAHQEAIFGAAGELLTLRHDSFDRACFMPGVALAVKRVGALNGLTYGLDALLT